MSFDALPIVDVLSRHANAVDPTRFPVDLVEASRPGMYAWWGDDHACAVLGAELNVDLDPLLYVGQAGATKWPSGKRSSATLATRIGRQHIRGNARSSTFRRTLSALLLVRLSLVTAGSGRLDRASNALVTEWIADHMCVAIAPIDDRDALDRIERTVLDLVDPPLNLGHCVNSEARARLTELRSRLAR